MRALISQVVTLECQIRLLERAGIKTDHDRRCLSSWLGAQRHALKAISGLKGAPSKSSGQIFDEHMARLAQLPRGDATS